MQTEKVDSVIKVTKAWRFTMALYRQALRFRILLEIRKSHICNERAKVNT